jgi:hypothetical protein
MACATLPVGTLTWTTLIALICDSKVAWAALRQSSIPLTVITGSKRITTLSGAYSPVRMGGAAGVAAVGVNVGWYAETGIIPAPRFPAVRHRNKRRAVIRWNLEGRGKRMAAIFSIGGVYPKRKSGESQPQDSRVSDNVPDSHIPRPDRAGEG